MYLLLLYILLLLVDNASCQSWIVTSAPSANWFGISTSSSGQYLAAVENGGYIFTSTDGVILYLFYNNLF